MKFDILVIGAGHAGLEAAHAAARMGCRVCLVTINIDMLGQMSCNPAIGGVAKGTIVREIDAMGGIMGLLADTTGIHFKMLNQSKGEAVWGPRAQIDKAHYRVAALRETEKNRNIFILQDTVIQINETGGRVSSVGLLSGTEVFVDKIIVTTGTFLNGLAHIGMASFSCGRCGEPPSLGLTQSINALGIKSGRLKTGTPARVDRRSVDFSVLTTQEGDENPWPFSFSTTSLSSSNNTVVCWTVRTSKTTHDIIRSNLDKSPLYSGKITGIGPRYCPSIEDKVVRYGEKDGHTLFLEPEGPNTNELYLNGFSTSLPVDIQYLMLRSLPGFSNAVIIRPAYAIEYDFFPPTQLHATLESRVVGGLYFAGQVNGTSGYEEAACQGLMAGINAASSLKGKASLVLGRETSYIGVLIDDLVTKGTDEPYRMFTSRAEYRLLLRQDNADERLMPTAASYGLLDNDVYEARQKVWDVSNRVKEQCKKAKVTQLFLDEKKVPTEIKEKISVAELLKRPEVTLEPFIELLESAALLDRYQTVSLEADLKYAGFIDKMHHEIGMQKKMDSVEIPESMVYSSIHGLLTESRQKLERIRPQTIGQASRISGVTPADISLLMIHLASKK